MLVETTINTHKSVLKLLNDGAARTFRSRTFMIKLLMQRVMNDNQRMLKSYSRIKYQARDDKKNWYLVHLVLNEYEYEYYLDMRKFFKMSVSYILAYAVKRYLSEIIDELLDMSKNTDNYLYRNYILIIKTINNVICWQIYWGIPLKLPCL